MKGLGSQVRERIFSYANEHHAPARVNAAQRSIMFDYEEPDTDAPTNAYHLFLGEECGERIYTAIRGGRRVKDLLPRAPSRRLPDVKRRKVWTEVKFTRVDSNVQLRDDQMRLYNHLQATLPSHRIELAIFRHCVDMIKTYPGSKAQLFAELSRKILYSAELSYDLMHGLHQGVDGLTTSYTARADAAPRKHVYEDCKYLKVAAPHLLVEETDAFLRKMGKNPCDYTVERSWSPEFLLQGNPVTKFPMVRIRYKNIDDWTREFAKQYFENYDAAEIDLAHMRRILPRQAANTDVPF